MSEENSLFNGFTEETVQFLLDLRFHNYTDYFHQEHDRYVRTVQTPFYELIEDLSPAMREIDPGMECRPHKCLSRIHRDTRFSRDKSPYRDHHWFLFRRAGEPREKSLFFFGEFGPERLAWGMGIWGDNRELTDQFRRRLTANPDGILALLDDMDMAKRRLFLGGSSFRKLPVPPEIPERLKMWYLIREMYIGKFDPDYTLAFSGALREEMEKDFCTLAPLYRLLRGIQDDIR